MAKILVVDDDEDQGRLRCTILGRKGHDACLALSADAAAAAFGERQINGVVMDLRLPKASHGLALIRHLKAARPEVPVWVVTGWAGDLEGQPEASLVEEILEKPVRMEKLLKSIARIVMPLVMIAATLTGLAAQQIPFTVKEAGAEVVARLHLSAEGADWALAGKEGVLAQIQVDGRPTGHAWVFGENTSDPAHLFLGALAAGPHQLLISPEPGNSAKLRLRTVKAEFEEITPADERYHVVANAPVLIAREDTRGKFSDVPMLAYAERIGSTLRYSIIFSNEDGGTSTRDLMARWGRTSDIEFIYQIDLRTAATLIQTKGHKEIPYEGVYEGRHPVLEVTTLNNMVSPGKRGIDFRLVPETAVLIGSRETVMDRHPWTYAVAAKELRREDKLRSFDQVRDENISDARNYLIAELNLAPDRSASQVVVRLKGGKISYGSSRGMVENYVTRDGWVRMAVELPPGTRIDDVSEIALDCVVIPATKERNGARDGTCGLAAPGRVMMAAPDYAPGKWIEVRGNGRWPAGRIASLEIVR